MKKLNKKGFTLIELLAVIVIMAILVAVAIPAVTRYLDTARKGTYVSTVQAAVDAVRNDVITQSFAGSSSKTYYLNSKKGCYTFDLSTGAMTEAKDDANKPITIKSVCIAKNTTPNKTTYLWSDGSINELLEKQLKTSPYGAAYNPMSNIVVTYNATATAQTPAGYSYKVNIVDLDKNGIIGKTYEQLNDAAVEANKAITAANN